MPDWLHRNLTPGTGLSWQDQSIRLLAALLLGACVAAVFLRSHGRTHERGGMLASTLMLLSVLISMVSMVIGESVALAFSLAGALSIVRFRTVVEDTRDTAFVIFAVVVGMAAGTGHLRIALLGLPVIGITCILLSRCLAPSPLLTGVLSVRLGLGRDANDVVLPVLAELALSHRLISAATAKQGSAMELSYSLSLGSFDQMTALVTRLNQVEGIQNVEVKTI